MTLCLLLPWKGINLKGGHAGQAGSHWHQIQVQEDCWGLATGRSLIHQGGGDGTAHGDQYRWELQSHWKGLLIGDPAPR